ncbi:MAG: YbaK/EbsC family protein [Gammaproteobacteria bacterium]|jgi:Ala-tRNA(Pro) deacylase
MATAISLEQYLIKNRIPYDVMIHPPTEYSMATAQAAGIPAACLAKSVVLCDEYGYLIAVVPATHYLHLGHLRRQLARSLRLATEAEMHPLFSDCIGGAVPPLGSAYGLDVIVDDSLNDQPEIFFEGGDHRELIRVTGGDFQRLLVDAMHGRFSHARSSRHAHFPHGH